MVEPQMAEPQRGMLNRGQPAISPSHEALRIDTHYMYLEGVGDEGVTPKEMATLVPMLKQAHKSVAQGSDGGLDAHYASLNLGRAMLPAVAEIKRVAHEIRAYDDVAVIGIGGSSLGAKAVWHALEAMLPPNPRIHFVENVDPFDLHRLLQQLQPARTAVIAVSKSGGTLETVVQYLVIRKWLQDARGGAAARQQWLVTDPSEGWLRGLATREQLVSLPVPPRVGGRYSVLTAVGLLPLAVAGIDIEELLVGAAANAERCSSDDVYQNPALEMAALYFLLDTAKQKRVSVMMPYVNRLRLFVDWYCQLWAESLGKHRDKAEPAGTLPVRAMGSVDQHSQLQMYLESRHDKMFTFLELARWENDVPIPLGDAAAAFPYLQDKTVADVIHAEFCATRQIIADTGHPNMTILVPGIDAFSLGQLIDLYQRTTVYAGCLYGIDPLDQPAVEKGKRLAIQYLS